MSTGSSPGGGNVGEIVFGERLERRTVFCWRAISPRTCSRKYYLLLQSHRQGRKIFNVICSSSFCSKLKFHRVEVVLRNNRSCESSLMNLVKATVKAEKACRTVSPCVTGYAKGPLFVRLYISTISLCSLQPSTIPDPPIRALFWCLTKVRL
jgi:hypothetical protein